MTPQPDPTAHGSSAVEHSPIVRMAQRVVPDLSVVSVSEPEPVTQRCNVVAVEPSTERAREAVLMLESVEKTTSTDSVGLVVMGSAPLLDDQGVVDESGATSGLGPRILLGGALGAAVGAAAGAGLGAINDDVGLVVPALGGAALLGAFGAIWMVFAGFGGSDAYRQTFVQPNERDLTLVTFHTDDQARADSAFERLAASGHRSVVMLDASLNTVLRERE